MAKDKINGYELSRKWFDWCFENPELVKPIHTALYFFAIEHCNRMGWKEKFGLPTEMTKAAIGVKSWHTYIAAFDDLVEWGFFNLIERSKNQFSSNIIALIKYDKALDKALDKAMTKHASKQLRSTYQSNDSIDKHITLEHITLDDDEKEKTSTSPEGVYGEIIFMTLIEIEKMMQADETWIADSAKRHHTDFEIIRISIPEYILHLKTEKIERKERKDAYRHFNNWFPKRKLNANTINRNSNDSSERIIGRVKAKDLAEFVKPRNYTQFDE